MADCASTAGGQVSSNATIDQGSRQFGKFYVPLLVVPDVFRLIPGVQQWNTQFNTLAADDECPQASYFRHVLYLTVGDAVRSGYHSRSRAQVESLLAAGEGLSSPLVQRWVARSRELMAHPSRFSYEAWCGGQLAYERAT